MSSFIGYESPITQIMRDIQTQIIKESENQIFQAVQNCEIKVDKEELIKALQYDRGQYEKGYKEGAIAELENIKAEFEKEIEIKKKQDYSRDFFIGICDCVMLIEFRLDELKGENKNDLP